MLSATEPDRNEAIPNQKPKRRFAAAVASVVVHGGALAFLVFVGTVARTKVVEPAPLTAMVLVENAGGAHAVKILLPVKDFAAHAEKPAPKLEATQKSVVPVEKKLQKMDGGGAPKIPHSGDGSGQALRGNGSDAEDMHPGFPIFSPHPPVTDRALLPATEVKVVVDVKLDAQGQVVGETLVKGVSTKLDQLCLNIVWTWRFQPATVNGKPVPSEAELIFPFTPSYPISGG
jgi:hypothetical protein